MKEHNGVGATGVSFVHIRATHFLIITHTPPHFVVMLTSGGATGPDVQVLTKKGVNKFHCGFPLFVGDLHIWSSYFLNIHL